MLETIREYAAEMLDGRGEATRRLERRHATRLPRLGRRRAAPQLSGADQRAWLDRLEREHDNLRAALDWATPTATRPIAARLAFALWRFWQQRGYLNEARARFDAMAARDWDLEPVDRARFAEAFGGIAYWQSDQPRPQRWYDVGAGRLARASATRREIANALYNRAYADVIVVMTGLARPRTTLDGGPGDARGGARALPRDLGDTAGEGNILWGLGSYYYFTADAATAETWYRRSRWNSIGRPAIGRWRPGRCTCSRCRPPASGTSTRRARQARHALRHFYEAGDISGVTLTLDDLAIVAVADGDPARAGRLWGAARHLQQTTGTVLADYVKQNYDLFGVPTPRTSCSSRRARRLTPAEGAADGPRRGRGLRARARRRRTWPTSARGDCPATIRTTTRPSTNLPVPST